MHDAHELARLTLPRGSFRIVEVNPGTFNGIRLPDGERWQWYALQGGGTAMRLRWGSIVTPPLEVLAAVGPSTLHVHPGRDVYVEFQLPAGSPLGQVWVVVSPTYGEYEPPGNPLTGEEW